MRLKFLGEKGPPSTPSFLNMSAPKKKARIRAEKENLRALASRRKPRTGAAFGKAFAEREMRSATDSATMSVSRIIIKSARKANRVE